MNLLYDEPIKCYDDDLLNRKEFVKEFVKNLLAVPNMKNMTISINGEWGSGKTSLINLIKQEMAFAVKDKILNDRKFVYYKNINFAPWNTLNEDSIIKQFFKTLISNFTEEKVNKVINSKVYDDVMSLLEEIPKIGKAFKVINGLLKKYSKSFLNGTEDLLEIKEKISNKLRNINFKFVVFIDDIDRLNNNEIKLLIQLIKAVCDFPNIIYVLSFDKNIVAKALSNEQGIDGYQYLEKIIQLSIDIPLIEDDILQDYLLTKMNIILDDTPEFEFDSYRWGNIFYNGFSQYFKTLRNVNRFINVINFKKERYMKVLDYIDFVTLEAISIFEPKLLSLVYSNRDFLCKDQIGDRFKPNIEVFRSEVEKISSNFKLLTFLFPILQNHGLGDYHENLNYNEQKYFGRVSIKQYLDFYFEGVLNKNYVSKYDISMFTALDDSDERKLFLEKHNDKSFNDFLRLFCTSLDYNYKNKSISFDVVFEIIEAAKDFKNITKMFHVKNEYLLHEIIDKLLLSSVDRNDSYNFLLRLYTMNTNYKALINILYHIAVNSKIYSDTNEINGESFLSEEEILKIHDTFVIKLKDVIYTDEYITNKNLVYVINFLNLRNSDIVSKWFNYIMVNKKIGEVIKNFYFTGNGESTKRFVSYYFNYDDCIGYIDLDYVKKIVGEKIINTMVEAEIGEILILMPKPINHKYYRIEDLYDFCKKNNILFRGKDEII